MKVFPSAGTVSTVRPPLTVEVPGLAGSPDANKSSVFTILVALPKAPEEAAGILKALESSWFGLASRDSHWILKFHPAQKKEELKVHYKKIEGELEERKDSFDSLVKISDLVISSASSVCMETIARGIPVIVIAGCHGLIHNPLPEEIQGEMWRLCYTADEIIHAVNEFKSVRKDERMKFQEYGRQIRGKYFNPVTPEAVKGFLGLS